MIPCFDPVTVTANWPAAFPNISKNFAMLSRTGRESADCMVTCDPRLISAAAELTATCVLMASEVRVAGFAAAPDLQDQLILRAETKASWPADRSMPSADDSVDPVEYDFLDPG